MLDHATAMPWKRCMLFVWCTYAITFQLTSAELDIDGVHSNVVQFWANSLGEQISSRCQKASKIEKLQEEYEKTSSILRIEHIDGAELVQKSAERIGQYLQIRYEAAKKIKEKAQTVFKTYKTDNYTCDSLPYHNSKSFKLYKYRDGIRLPEDYEYYYEDDNSTRPEYKGPNMTSYLRLYDEWDKYYQVPVSIEGSTIHVPTNIYDCAPPLLDNISWTGELDEVFQENHDKMKSSWQFFASSAGFMRFFPGAHWNYNGMDMYDARLTEWYTGAASTPKSVVILLDISGSMTGLRMEIAKTTVKKIMESLQENDFFNLITFNVNTSFVDEDCYYSNGTLIQATARNIRRVTRALNDVISTEMANFTSAFTLAFEVLTQANEQKLAGETPNNAIMLVTDGAPESYEDVFRKYNWEIPDGTNKVTDIRLARVFSYLIGQEVTLSNKKQVRWMGCENKGYFYHIGTMADVHDYVQDYVRVMARPLAVQQSNHYTWTGVHVTLPLDTESVDHGPQPRSKDWIRLPSDAAKPMMTISVALPVYDTREEERNNGNLLGVAGIDVNVDEIRKLVPHEQLGITGYMFIINNNGFVVWHPDFRPMVEPCKTTLCSLLIKNNPQLKENRPFPDYKNIDLTYLEQEYNPGQGQIEKLRTEMINGASGSITATVKKFYSHKGKSKIYTQTQKYYYAPIANTSYSIAIARVEPLDSQIIYTDKPTDLQSLDWCRLIVSSWDYCGSADDIKQPSSLEETIELLGDKCGPITKGSVVYDVNVTRGMATDWLDYLQTKDERDIFYVHRPCPPGDGGCERRKEFEKKMQTLKYDMIMLGTRSGVVRYQEGNMSKYGTVEQQSAYNKVRTAFAPSLESEFFQKVATAFRKDVWMLDINVPDEGDASKSITASKGIYIQKENILASVLGLTITYDSLYQMLNFTTSFCGENQNCTTLYCHRSDVDCFLLDQNAYIVVAEDDCHLGKPFSQVDNQVLLDMADNGMFTRVDVTDYQALCTICTVTGKASSASSIIDPFRYLSRILWWYITKTALFLIEFNIYDIWHCLRYATADTVPSPNDISAKSKEVYVKERHMVLYTADSYSIASSANQLQPCRTCKVHRNSALDLLGIDTNSTTTKITFEDEARNLTEVCETSKKDKSYIANRIPKTNLYLLVLENGCRCATNDEEYCIEEHELENACSGDFMGRYRRPPPGSLGSSNFGGNSDFKEEFETCGKGSQIKSSTTLLTLLFLLVRWKNR